MWYILALKTLLIGTTLKNWHTIHKVEKVGKNSGVTKFFTAFPENLFGINKIGMALTFSIPGHTFISIKWLVSWHHVLSSIPYTFVRAALNLTTTVYRDVE